MNLKDCAPFASMARPGLSPADAQRWAELYRQGIAAESGNKFAEAVEAYNAAAAVDDTFADLQFRLGRCMEGLGRFEEAARHYTYARDCDALPFRADGRLIEILRNIAADREAEGHYLADVGRAFEQDSPHCLPGDTLFYEHVHMNFHGNYVAARAVLTQVERSLGDAPAGGELAEPECAERLAFTGWDRRRTLRIILDRVKRLEKEIAGLAARTPSELSNSSSLPAALSPSII
ncbi:MAG: hypothetical protein NTW87_27315 [Planctomycetota bacterium]|nr:hypothetical protein [Planctomycetota bacterium]